MANSACTPIDRTLLASARVSVGAELDDLKANARTELAPFRAHLDANARRPAVNTTVDRRLRDRLRLPAGCFKGG